MAKKKKNSATVANKNRSSKKTLTAPRTRTGTKNSKPKRRTAKKRSTTASPETPQLRLTWDLARLMTEGLPTADTRSHAYHFICDEGISLTWVCEVLSKVLGRTITVSQVTKTLRRSHVPMITLSPGDDGPTNSPSHMPSSDYRTLIQLFAFPGNPKKVNMSSDTFMHPRGMSIVETTPEFAAVKKHKAWVRLKKMRDSVG